MTIKDLTYFYELSRLQSYTKVAEKFQVSQPSVSYSVRRLEEKFNCELIVKDPSHRTFKLTQQGQILAKHSKEILLELERLDKDLARSFLKETVTGFPPIISGYVLDKLLSQKMDISFLSNLHTIYGGSKELLQSLLAGNLDISLIGSLQPLRHPKLITKELYQKSFYFVLSENHPLAGRDCLNFEDVLKEPFILLDERHIHYDAFKDLNEKYQNAAQVLVRLDDVFMVAQMIKENLGITLLTDIAFPQEFKGLVKIPLVQDEMTFHVSYAYPKSAVLTPQTDAFIALLNHLAEDPQNQ